MNEEASMLAQLLMPANFGRHKPGRMAHISVLAFLASGVVQTYFTLSLVPAQLYVRIAP